MPSKEAERFCSCPPERAARAFQEGWDLSHGTLKSSRAASDTLWLPFMGVKCLLPVSVCEVHSLMILVSRAGIQLGWGHKDRYSAGPEVERDNPIVSHLESGAGYANWRVYRKRSCT